MAEPFHLRTEGETEAELLPALEKIIAHYGRLSSYRTTDGKLIVYTSLAADLKGVTVTMFNKPMNNARALEDFVTKKLATFPEPVKPARQDSPQRNLLGWKLFTPTEAGGSLDTPLQYAFTIKRHWVLARQDA